MDASRLRQLISAGESQTVDFKIECNAFHGGTGATAELAKDIVAMANNGNRYSYLIIGVSDDGTNLKSCRNAKLNDEAVQDLVKTAVDPVPRVAVLRVPYKVNKNTYDLVVIRIGRNKRQAYRFARDFIDYVARVVFRRNEVWIRRGTTSDLATPEEIARLVAGSDPAGERLDHAVVTVYARLPWQDRWPAMSRDLETSAESWSVALEGRLASVQVDGRPFVLRVLYSESIPPETRLPIVVQRAWGFEHGLLLLTPGRVPPKYFFRDGNFTFGLVLDSRERWGTYAQVPVPGSGRDTTVDSGLIGAHFNKALRNGPALTVPVFILSGLRSTTDLTKKAKQLATDADTPGLREQLCAFRDALEETLERVLVEGPLIRDMALGTPSTRRDDPKRMVFIGEGSSEGDYGTEDRLKTVASPMMRAPAEFVLALASGTSLDEASRKWVPGEKLIRLDYDDSPDEASFAEWVLERYDPEGLLQWRSVRSSPKEKTGHDRL